MCSTIPEAVHTDLKYYSKATEEYYSKGSPRIWDLWSKNLKNFENSNNIIFLARYVF